MRIQIINTFQIIKCHCCAPNMYIYLIKTFVERDTLTSSVRTKLMTQTAPMICQIPGCCFCQQYLYASAQSIMWCSREIVNITLLSLSLGCLVRRVVFALCVSSRRVLVVSLSPRCTQHRVFGICIWTHDLHFCISMRCMHIWFVNCKIKCDSFACIILWVMNIVGFTFTCSTTMDYHFFPVIFCWRDEVTEALREKAPSPRFLKYWS